MTMVCGLDLHRRQITFDALEVESGEMWTRRVWQPDRERFRRWLRDDVTERAHGCAVPRAVEGCTGWRYVVEELVAAGFERTWRSRPTHKRRGVVSGGRRPTAANCRLLRELLQDGRVPASWIPPTVVLEWRERAPPTRRWSIGARRGCNGSTPSCTRNGVTLTETSIRWARTRELLEDDGLIEAY